MIVTLPKSKSLHFFLDLARASNVCKVMQNKEFSQKSRNLAFPACQREFQTKISNLDGNKRHNHQELNNIKRGGSVGVLQNNLILSTGLIM